MENNDIITTEVMELEGSGIADKIVGGLIGAAITVGGFIIFNTFIAPKIKRGQIKVEHTESDVIIDTDCEDTETK